jgi:hypothetical protein
MQANVEFIAPFLSAITAGIRKFVEKTGENICIIFWHLNSDHNNVVGLGLGLASYYMSLAEEIFPVIQVGATRSATFVVTQGTEIVFDKQLTIGKKDGAYDL